jgi:hypothetical protein
LVRKQYWNGSTNVPFGRLYSKKADDLKGKQEPSFVDLDSSLRAYVANSNVRELDLAKSQPTILMHWARWLQLHDAEEAIHDYVHKDKERLQQIIDALQTRRCSSSYGAQVALCSCHHRLEHKTCNRHAAVSRAHCSHSFQRVQASCRETASPCQFPCSSFIQMTDSMKRTMDGAVVPGTGYRKNSGQLNTASICSL